METKRKEGNEQITTTEVGLLTRRATAIEQKRKDNSDERGRRIRSLSARISVAVMFKNCPGKTIIKTLYSMLRPPCRRKTHSFAAHFTLVCFHQECRCIFDYCPQFLVARFSKERVGMASGFRNRFEETSRTDYQTVRSTSSATGSSITPLLSLSLSIYGQKHGLSVCRDGRIFIRSQDMTFQIPPKY